MDYKKKMNNMLVEASAIQDLKSMVKGDKELPKDKIDRIDAIFIKYEKDIAKIEKKYKLDADELGALLTKI